MSKIFSNIQPAIKTETRNVTIYTLVGVVAMWIVFFILHLIIPEKVVFDYTVILGGLGGGFIAVLNFFLLGLTVQKVASTENQEIAQRLMKSSYSKRMLLQGVWVVIAISAPCFQFVAGMVPLLFPGTGIKIVGIINR